MPRKKKLVGVPRQAQPISSEKLKDIHIRNLEVTQAAKDLRYDWADMCRAAGVDEKDWDVDFRNGTMTRRKEVGDAPGEGQLAKDDQPEHQEAAS